MHRQRKDNWTGSKLDASGCLTLRQILGSFSAPITEEHAWAIIFESLKTLHNCLGNPALASKLFTVNSLNHILIHQEGYVAENTFMPSFLRGRLRESL